jgi:hypothetical protein
MLTIAIIVLLICNIACLFLLFTMNVLLEKWKKWYWAELDFNYQTQIKWVKHSKDKLKLLKLGLGTMKRNFIVITPINLTT